MSHISSPDNEPLLFFPDRMPCVPFEQRGSLPRSSAIYFALSDGGDVLYIGAAQNLFRRWKNHHLRLTLAGWTGVNIAYDVCPIEVLATREQLALQQFTPPFNHPTAKRYPQRERKLRLPPDLSALVKAQASLYRVSKVAILRMALTALVTHPPVLPQRGRPQRPRDTEWVAHPPLWTNSENLRSPLGNSPHSSVMKLQ